MKITIIQYFKDLFLIAVLFFASPLFAQKKINLTSPNGHIEFKFMLTDSLPVYSILYNKQIIIEPSSLSLDFAQTGLFGKKLNAGKAAYRAGVDDYNLIVGKTKKVHDEYNEVSIPLQESKGDKRLINLIVRAFNEGIAFRYEIPAQANWHSYELASENTTFKFTGNPMVLTGFLPDYTSSHEARHQWLSLNEIKEDTLMDMPTLVQFPGNIYMGITEAELVDYAGMYLVKKNGVFESSLSPLPNQTNIKVKATLPHQSPWRVMLISNRLGNLIESNIITSLNEPCAIKDVSWIKPGTSDFHWWNGDILPDTTFPPQEDFNFNKYYIDFCSRNQITYHSVIGYGGYPWYTSDAEGYGVIGPNTDVTKPVPTVNMDQICAYAKSKNVGIRFWVHWQAIYPDLEKSFAQFEKWGLKGMMVDFLNRDDQEMVNIQTQILQAAAKHHLHIQFHGAYKPTGLSRTYPNEFTREGTLNYENDKWGDIITPDDDLGVVFTRMLAGATDYHLGGFRAVPASKYKIQYTRPLVVGTRCHMLAMYIVLESYLQMICDYPEAYEGQPGFDFLKNIPTTWDETKVLNAEVNKYITIARKKNNNWYVGSITNHEARQLKLNLDFLPDGNYAAEIYADAADTDESPNNLTKSISDITNKDIITVSLSAGGGAAIHIYKKS